MNLPKIALGAWAWGNDGTFGVNYTEEELKRFDVLPGILGPNTCLHYHRTIEKKNKLDVDYVDNYSFKQDLNTVLITFKNARKAVEVAEMLPLDRLLLETDCPYMAPVPMRGKRNDSSLISYVAEKMAEIKNTDAQSVLDIATKNTKDLFNL